MDALPITSTTVRWLAGGTIVFQAGLLLAVPIPSPVSIRRVRARLRSGRASATASGPDDGLAMRLLPVGTAAGLLAVIAAVIWPAGAATWLLPAGSRFPGWLAPAGGLCLLTGNGLIAAATASLKQNTVFDAAGQSRRLVTDGVFGLMQHPILSGTAVIYLGLFLIFPSPLLLAGLACYGWHQGRRLAAEEALLEQHFGPPYRDYRRRVGRFGPRWSHHAGRD